MSLEAGRKGTIEDAGRRSRTNIQGRTLLDGWGRTLDGQELALSLNERQSYYVPGRRDLDLDLDLDRQTDGQTDRQT